MHKRNSTYSIRVVDPENPDQLLIATLSWSTGSSVELTFEFLNGFPVWAQASRVAMLHAIKPEPITFFELLRIQRHNDKITFHSSIAFFGETLLPETSTFNELQVYVDGCANWFGVHGFTEHLEPTGPAETQMIAYQTEKVELWNVSESLTLGYGVSMRTTFSTQPCRVVTLEEQPYLRIQLASITELEDAIRTASKALAFLEFVTDERILIQRVFASNNDSEGSGVEVAAAWNQEPRTRHASLQPLVYFEVLKANFSNHLSRWFDLYTFMPLALDLYRKTKRTSHLPSEVRYLSIVAALEGLHRSIFESEPPERCPHCRRAYGKPLEQRFKDIVGRYGHWIRELLPESHCKAVADTRNYLAHHTPDLAKRALPSDELFYWFRRLTMVFEICLLAELPFLHQDALNNIIENRWSRIKSGSLGEWNMD